MTLQATLPFELDTLEILVDVDMCFTAMVVVNLDISSKTVSNRLIEEWQEGSMEDGTVDDGTKVIELHISSSMVIE